MEESEKRRERLRAMRAEAAEADSHGNSITPPLPTSGLTNPLTEIPSQEGPRSAPRFDFYTDPMSAFSDDKRRIGHFAPPVVNNTSPVLRFPPPPPPGKALYPVFYIWPFCLFFLNLAFLRRNRAALCFYFEPI